MSTRAESIRVMCPLFQAGEGGSTPTSALQLRIEPIPIEHAQALNALWHSRLPRLSAKMWDRFRFPCYAAEFDGLIYAIAVWSKPISRSLPQQEWLELRRLAIASDAPPNTASRMLAIMAKLIRCRLPWVTTLISYQDTEVHVGTIYKAAGWIPTTININGNWDRPSRRRPKAQSYSPKRRWEKHLCPEITSE